MIRRSMLVASAFALLACAGTSAQAAFTYTTQISSINGVDYTKTAGNGVGTGGVQFTTGTATTITFNNSQGSGNAVAYPSEALTLTGTFDSTAASTITVAELINVINNGVTGTFTETVTYNLTVDGLARQPGIGVAPTSLVIGGTMFTANMAQATSTGYNQATANAAISATVTASAVPEPASIAMLGLGLGGVGLVARRRRAA